MSHQVEQFYDSLAEVYHLIFEDWNSAIARQARILNALIAAQRGPAPQDILDCACGIGTQAIGLAALGHRVSGSDLSSEAVQRAAQEAAERRVTLDTRVSNMTSLANFPDSGFDVLGAFDNALPHLSRAELLSAIRCFRRVLRPGGMFIASIRDYDDLIKTQPTVQGPSFFGSPGERRIVHQVWDWTEADAYVLHQYISSQQPAGWKSLHAASPYRCLLRAELSEALGVSGFTDIAWQMPFATGYYQPVITATAPQNGLLTP